MKPKSMNGTKGVLLINDGEIVFRVYNFDKTFTDYELRHSDLQVIISDDDAYVWETPNGLCIDHSPNTLWRNV